MASMHCPNCGKPATSDQQFCRACGMSLEVVGKLVTSHSSSPAGSNQTKVAKAESEKVILQLMLKWMAWGFLVLGLGIVMLVTNKTFGFGKLFGLLSSFVLLAGTGIATYGLLKALREGVALSGKAQPPSIAEPEPTNYLPTERLPTQMPHSITERTTQLIPEDVSKTRE